MPHLARSPLSSSFGLPNTLAEAFKDIVAVGQRLDKLLGAKRRLFAYPNGSCNRAIAELVRQAKHSHALTTVSRPWSTIDHPLLLPRISTSDVSGATLAEQRGLS